MDIYTVFIKEGVIQSDCYVRGGNVEATDNASALAAFNKKYRYNLKMKDVNITKI